MTLVSWTRLCLFGQLIKILEVLLHDKKSMCKKPTFLNRPNLPIFKVMNLYHNNNSKLERQKNAKIHQVALKPKIT